ncbi:MAG: S49 family peptidase [Chloroflexi bacterium]|nr:S49 family peptidase [Chloroflexota bacterium]
MGKVIDSIKRSIVRCLRSYPFWLLIAIAAAYFVFRTFIGVPQVGIIRIADTSLDPWDGPQIAKMIEYVEANSAIKAVVLEVDSPGGGAVTSEEVYLNVLRLKKKVPVVAYVNLWSLSGGYYIAAAASYIYAKPTSMVGNIGVLSSLPPEREQLSEDTIGSGPLKMFTPRRDAVVWLEMIKEGFLRAVVSQRGDRLKLSKEELSKGGIYLGMEALRHGLIDEIGSSSDAVKKAADMAGLRRYEVVDINKKLGLLPAWYEGIFFGKNTAPLEPKALNPPLDRLPMFYYISDLPR